MRRRTFCGMLPVLFVLLFVVFVQGQGVKQNRADRIPSLSGLIFTDNLLFSKAGASTVACAKLCLKTETCTTFTHRKATPTTLSACRGHSGYFTASSPHENIAGTGVYQFRAIEAAVIETTTEITTLAEITPEITTLAETTPEITTLAETTPEIITLAEIKPEITVLAETTPEITALAETTPEITALAEITTQANWLLAECSSDSQCTDTVANTRCFLDQCMCIQGYYYSVSSKACIETCSNLDNSYLHYVSSVMMSDLTSTGDVTVQQCQDHCNADDACLSVNYSSTGRCYVQHVTAREPTNWDETALGWNFYQRNCQ